MLPAHKPARATKTRNPESHALMHPSTLYSDLACGVRGKHTTAHSNKAHSVFPPGTHTRTGSHTDSCMGVYTPQLLCQQRAAYTHAAERDSQSAPGIADEPPQAHVAVQAPMYSRCTRSRSAPHRRPPRSQTQRCVPLRGSRPPPPRSHTWTHEIDVARQSA